VSLFVAGAGFGEIWRDSRKGKGCFCSIESAPSERESTLGCEAGCGLRFYGRIGLGSSCSDHGRIGRAMEITFHLFSILQAHFTWQAQLVISEHDFFHTSPIFFWEIENASL